MLPKEFRNLSELSEFLVQQMNYNDENGFSFYTIAPGFDLKQIESIAGNSTESNLEDEQQQTLKYNILIDHLTEGKREHHKLTVLFWAFEQAPLEVIRLHFDYYKTGDFAAAFQQTTDELFESLIQKFGEPEKKILKKGNKEISYSKGKRKLLIWLNAEGVRIQIK